MGKDKIMMRAKIRACLIIGLAVALSPTEVGSARQRQRTRRSQRVRMERVELASPDGKVKLAILPNAAFAAWQFVEKPDSLQPKSDIFYD